MTDPTEPAAPDRPDDAAETAVAATTEVTADAVRAGSTPHRSSPGAQAASRARRIGGRPLPGPRPSPQPADGTELIEPAADEPEVSDSSPRTKPAAARLSTAAPPALQRVDPSGYADAGALRGRGLRRRGDRLRWAPAVVAGAAAAVLLVLTIVLSHGVWWGKSGGDRQAVRQQVLGAAKPCVAAIVSYDYRNLDKSEKAGQACITGKFRNDYTQAMETTVKTLAPQTKTVQVFQIAKAGIESVGNNGRQFVVLLYGQQSVTNTTTQKGNPRLDILTVEATLDRVGDTWLVSSIH